jgi:hypothetical protein
MAVAPSFQKYPTYGEPYEKNGRQYIRIVYGDGHHREVRWYAETPSKAPQNKTLRPLKDVLGFSKGYITIFKGDTYALLDWFRESAARYHSIWGWYFVSEDELPQFPAGIEPIQLNWEQVAFVDEDQLRPESQVREYIDSLMYEPSASRWQGEVGDRISRTLTVTKVTELEGGYYGPSTFHLFTDEAGNEYCWTTAAKKLELGKTYEITGTIKQLQKYKGKEQSVLTRCRVN